MQSLTAALVPLNLVTLGIGAVIARGLRDHRAGGELYAGQAVPLSYGPGRCRRRVRGLCYAEMASAVPRFAGSAYTYS